MIRLVAVTLLSFLAFVFALLLWCAAYASLIGSTSSTIGGQYTAATPVEGLCITATRTTDSWLTLRMTTGEVNVEAGYLAPGKSSERYLRLPVLGTLGYAIESPKGNCRLVRVTVPSWLVLVGLLSYPVLAFLRGPVHRWRYRRRGLCAKCGYDLRGSPGRCPECGDAIRRRE